MGQQQFRPPVTRGLDRVETSGGIQASLGGRYALALFELARDAKSIDAVENSLSRVRDAIDQSAEFKALIASPVVARGAAVKAVLAAGDQLGVDGVTKNFLGVLAENRRLGALPQIIRAFRQLAARHRGEVAAEVTSAHPLTEDQVGELKQQLRTRVGREVAVDLSVDPALLGGLVVRIGSQMIDSSIRTRLNALASAMKG
ncbi:F0F1 ATP synthase subunit delta [Sphingomonas sp. MA1305]|nr:F0F1 ATP synthase subunit delta [Sphingomonas sp. MA1305]MBI0476799.1 F0F1 ATP synthase subunit delta [Sphingomonas sp. MA1305]